LGTPKLIQSLPPLFFAIILLASVKNALGSFLCGLCVYLKYLFDKLLDLLFSQLTRTIIVILCEYFIESTLREMFNSCCLLDELLKLILTDLSISTMVVVVTYLLKDVTSMTINLGQDNFF
jgi:hypothetical protein